MSYEAKRGRRVALVAGALFLGSLVTACDSITAPQQSVASQVDAQRDAQIESVDRQMEEADFLQSLTKPAEE